MYENEYITLTPKRCALTEVTNASYVSPTANLKLLTNVALQYPTPPPSAVQRKEKSLQILCDKFLNLFPLQCNGTMKIQLDSTAARLGVEKRRMYDIINILEAMKYAVHEKKNTYLWHGESGLSSFLKILKKQGENLRLSEALRGRAPKPPPPKHKTLGILAKRFLMLFLVEPPNTLINLEMAVKVLIDNSNKNKSDLSPEQLDRQHKSKVRRLYDIANVFISIGLIEKVSGNLILKKPVFKYVGRYKVNRLDDAIKTPSPITPLTALDTYQKLTPCHVYAGRSKRKLEFTTPSSESKLGVTTPPHTPSHKWDEILLVADMELSRINKGV
ncbi:PREDICTED: transcription factor E2F7-like [Papilio xuthus]|uniref:Transcription factor E2F7 n=1 Tax=Papilio xuthus TaxID=66420 RepID=A0A194PL59_PAPXU|nr:PREDICTED: transcription factor E2F7-like [Papilio xuthus]KPI93469.1 Transcription factor E2F7 [Papilio xuthus]